MTLRETPRERLAAVSALAAELDLTDAPGSDSLAAWFLGPMAENQELLASLIDMAIASHCEDRRQFYPGDPVYVTEAVKDSEAYRRSVETMRREYRSLLDRLRGSVPFFSYRYQAHMNWDVTLPALAGYFAAMLYNPNNVALEGSPVTTRLEEEVGRDLCRLLGYAAPGTPEPWGHVTCDGTVANLEALWSARNLTYYPLAVAEAIRRHPHALGAARGITVRLADGRDELPLLDLDAWQGVNLPVPEVLGLPGRMTGLGVARDDLALVNAYTVQYLGLDAFRRRLLGDDVGDPAVLVTATMHYSWPKAAAMLGIGQGGLIPVAVDLDARADLGSLRTELAGCARGRRPVVCAVAVLGSTEQSAVDPLDGMLDVREEFRAQGVSFPVHVDAAWGGYFAAIRRRRTPSPDGHRSGYTPDLLMSAYVNRQYDRLGQADSITIDPHKAGFAPYPAGALCYRDGTQRNLVAFSAPYLDQGAGTTGVGLFGVEGSKPGAAAAGVYLSHRLITTDERGYGALLGQTLFNSKRLYAAVVTLGLDYPGLLVVPFQRLPAERRHPGDAVALAAELHRVRELIVARSNEEIMGDEEAMRLLAQLGSDQTIVAYAFNARDVATGKPNPNLAAANRINRLLAERLMVPEDLAAAEGMPAPEQRPELILSGSQLDPRLYGRAYVGRLMDRLGVAGDPSVDPITHLISCTMDPWLTATEAGDFLPTLRAALAHAALRAIRDANP